MSKENLNETQKKDTKIVNYYKNNYDEQKLHLEIDDANTNKSSNKNKIWKIIKKLYDKIKATYKLVEKVPEIRKSIMITSVIWLIFVFIILLINNFDITQKDAVLNNTIIKLKTEVSELQAKVDQAKPWFDEQEKKKKEEQARLEAEKKAKEEKEAAEKAKIEAEQKAKAEKVAAEQKAKTEKEEAEKKAKEAENIAAKEAMGVNIDELKSDITYIIEDDFRQNIEEATINELKVMEHLGTDSNKDAIVTARFSWNQFYDEGVAKDMLPIFSNRIAAKIAEKLEDGSEIFLFWKANYAKLTSKHTYKVKGGKAYIGDVNYGYMR